MSGELKHRGAPRKKASHTDLNGGANNSSNVDRVLVKAKQDVKETVGAQWDYKIALVVLTLLGFATRFYGITHPNSVVFDEVHFGKVRRGFIVHAGGPQ
jgi:dolichyl-phosphate-mannose-protein mannosyltransferase